MFRTDAIIMAALLAMSGCRSMPRPSPLDRQVPVMRNRDLVPVVLQRAPASFERQPGPWRGTRRPESGEGMGPEVEHLESLEAARRNDKTVKTVARGGIHRATYAAELGSNAQKSRVWLDVSIRSLREDSSNTWRCWESATVLGRSLGLWRRRRARERSDL